MRMVSLQQGFTINSIQKGPRKLSINQFPVVLFLLLE